MFAIVGCLVFLCLQALAQHSSRLADSNQPTGTPLTLTDENIDTVVQIVQLCSIGRSSSVIPPAANIQCLVRRCVTCDIGVYGV